MVPRAPRYAIQIPLRYRPLGDANWREGQTENISSSGVLFRAEQVMEVNTPIEINLVMPAVITGEPAGAVVCSGRIVRRATPAGPDTRPALAATISDFQFLRGQNAPNP